MQHGVKCFLSECCVVSPGRGRMQKIGSEESGSTQPNIDRYVYSRYHNNHSCWQPERQTRNYPWMRVLSLAMCVCATCVNCWFFFFFNVAAVSSLLQKYFCARFF